MSDLIERLRRGVLIGGILILLILLIEIVVLSALIIAQASFDQQRYDQTDNKASGKPDIASSQPRGPVIRFAHGVSDSNE